jgi:CRISPR-associated protein Csd1
MNWIQSLYQTFEYCSVRVGVRDQPPLLPIAHIPQQVQIEITVNGRGEFLSAKVLSPQEPPTIIPCTEASAGRTSGIAPHPLADSLKHVAGDYYDYTDEKEPASKKADKLKTHHEHYVENLKKWSELDAGNAKLSAVLQYVQNGSVMRDLVNSGVFPTVGGKIQEKWPDKEKNVPPLFGSKSNPWDAFVRWSVAISGEPESQTYWDATLWESWIRFYCSNIQQQGLCYVTGGLVPLADQHPRKIRSTADGAKLISANDGSGFTFRGRFTDQDGRQTCGVSFDVTQKAHNALRWLIARQGKRIGDQAIVAWAVTGQDIPDALVSTADLVDAEDELLNAGLSLAEDSVTPPNTGETIALALNKKISGYHAKLGDTTRIVVLALDSATTGRMAISYYRELTSSEYLQRIEKWHTETAWFQYRGKAAEFIGAPSPLDIAICAHGTKLGSGKLQVDDNLKAATHSRLLPCIIENRPIPNDLVDSCVRRASARPGLERWEWEKALGIACALYRKQQIQTNKHHHTMSLERTRTTRSYLYGRLLAVADLLEQATYQKDEKRATHAARSMQTFADRPFQIWANIEKSLVPYRRTLASNKPELLGYYDREIREIMDLFPCAEQFRTNEKLDGEFLLAYHCQRTALWLGKKTQEPETEPDEK